MNLSIALVRELYYAKIIKLYDTEEFEKALSVLNMNTSTIQDKPFSLPSYFDTLKKNTNNEGNPIMTLLTTTDPMIVVEQSSNISKGRFRDMWTQLWKSVGKSSNLTKNRWTLLSSMGIRLILACNLDNKLNMCYKKEIDIVTSFYNSIINVYLTLRFENKISLENALFSLIKTSDKDLIEILLDTNKLLVLLQKGEENEK